MEAERVAKSTRCVTYDCGHDRWHNIDTHQLCVGTLWRTLELVSRPVQSLAIYHLVDMAQAQRLQQSLYLLHYSSSSFHHRHSYEPPT